MEAISFRNHKGETLRGFIHEPKSYEHAAIFLHGFPGHCDGTAKRICRELAKYGILCLRFDFSGTDRSDGRFIDKLISKEVKEIRSAVDFLRRNYRFKTLTLLGTSTGAIEAGLYAHTDRRINKLVLLGTIFRLDESVRIDFTDRQVHDFWVKGFITYKRAGKWYHNKRLGKAYYDEYFRLDLPASIRRFRRPLLIIHGSKDEYIPLSHAKKLLKSARRPKKLIVIKGADHSYRGKIKLVSQKIAHFIA